MTAKTDYKNAWIAEKLDRVNLTMPKGKKESIKSAADRQGISVNAFINNAIDAAISTAAVAAPEHRENIAAE